MNDTSIARGVRSVASDYDTACKRLLSEKQVLSRILHEWLHEFAKTNPCDIEHKCLEGEPRIGVDRVDRDEAAAARICALQNGRKGAMVLWKARLECGALGGLAIHWIASCLELSVGALRL